MAAHFFFTYELFFEHPPRLLPLLQKLKEGYTLWYSYLFTLPKIHRHSLGQKIDSLFVEAIEAVAAASFSSGTDKLPYTRHAIKKMDTLKLFLMILWETKSLDNNKYLALSVRLDEIGRMLGGWQGQLLKKQNSSNQ